MQGRREVAARRKRPRDGRPRRRGMTERNGGEGRRRGEATREEVRGGGDGGEGKRGWQLDLGGRFRV
jgi:hypothetical protein